MASELFQKLRQAQANFETSPSTENEKQLTNAEAFYFSAQSGKRILWNKVPDSAAKDSAEVNANETLSEQGDDWEDKIQWYTYAMDSYAELINSGIFNPDGSYKE